MQRTSTLIERRRQLASSRSAFSLVELIIVIIIIAILAGVAYFGYQALVGRANNEKSLAAARSFGSEFRGLVGFDNGAGSNGARVLEVYNATGNVPTGVELFVEAGTGTAGVRVAPAVVVGALAANVLAGTSNVLLVDDADNDDVADATERAVCLTLPTSAATQIRQVPVGTAIAAGQYSVSTVAVLTAGTTNTAAAPCGTTA
jgi:prepilin-type N-terminal cleavage/methylation domain-containing protein